MPRKAGLLLRSFLFVFLSLSVFSLPAFADDYLSQLASASRDVLLSRGVDSLDKPVSSAVHFSGSFAFVADGSGDSISVFKVAETRLTHIQTLRDGESDTQNLDGIVDLEISPDGRFLYAASANDDAVAVFSVDQDSGKMTPMNSYVQGARDASGTLIEGLNHFLASGVNDLALSPSGTVLAVTNSWGGGALFRRDVITGRLSFLRRSFPGYSLGNNYVTFGASDQELFLLNSLYDDVVVFSLSNTGTLTRTQLIDNGRNGIRGMDGPVAARYQRGVLYVSSTASDTLSVLSKSGGTAYAKIQEIANGALEPSGLPLRALLNPGKLEIGQDGLYLYLASSDANAIGTFSINASDGRLSPVAQTFDVAGSLDGVAHLKSIPGAPWLLAVVSDSNRLQLYAELLRYPQNTIKILQPEQAEITITETDSLELKAYAWLVSRGDISREIKWYNQTGTVLGNGRTLTLSNMAIGNYTIAAKYSVTGTKLVDTLLLHVVDSGNGVPVITSRPPLNASAGVIYEYRMQAIDDSLTSSLRFSLVSGPAGMVAAPTGLVSWTPTAAQVGLHPVVLRVIDQRGAYSEQSYVVEVKMASAAYAISFTSEPVVEALVGNQYRYDSDAVTSSGAELKYYIQVSPEGMSIEEQTGVISWTPQVRDIGSNPVSIRVMDGLGNSADQSFIISVPEGRLPPEIVSVPEFNALKDQPFSYAIKVNPVNSAYSYSVVSSAQGASVNTDGILRWQPSNEYLETLSVENKNCGIPVPELGSFDPLLKWHWSGGQVRNPPLVAQFNDDNGDGAINYLDNPDVAFVAYAGREFQAAWIEVVDGATGVPLTSFIKPTEQFHAYGQIAVGDINNDGLIEVVGTTNDRFLVAYRVTGGAPIWKKPIPAVVSLRNHVGLYDLDADGRTEILAGKAVFEFDGDLKWVIDADDAATGGTFSFGSFDSREPKEDQQAYAAELDSNSYGLEVVLGHQVYSAAGVRLWQGEGASASARDYANGFSAIADLQNDHDPELIVVSSSAPYVVAYETGGKRVWAYQSERSGGGGPPTVGDIDGDGFVEIAFVRDGLITVLNHDGSLLWRAPIQETSSGITGSTIFDFEGDGEAELLYGDEQFLRAYDKKGAVKYQVPNISGTWTEYPVIADVNNDGHADILMPSSDSEDVAGNANTTKGVRVFSDANNNWAGTRAIWNQHAYHIDNINDDGSIPRIPVQSYTTHNTFRVSNYSGAAGLQQIDLAPVDLRLQERKNAYHLWVDVLNRTAVPVYYEFDVDVYHGEPETGQLIAQKHIVGAKPNERQAIDLGFVDPSIWTQDVSAVIRATGTSSECNIANNILKAAFFDITASDNLLRSDKQYFLVSVSEFNTPPEIISVPPTTTLRAATAWTYIVIAHDDNLGDSLHYSLLNAPEGMEIDQFTGRISWRPAVSAVGDHQVNIVVSDVSGNSVEQVFTATVERNLDVNNPPYFEFQSHYEVTGGAMFRMVPAVLDREGVVARIELVSNPPNTSVNVETNELTWLATNAGVYDFILRATDEQGLSGLGKFSLWVTNTPTTPDDGVNPPEIVEVPSIIAFVAGQTNQYALPLPDNSADYTYRLITRPPGLTLASNVINWTPLVSNIGQHAVSVELSNGIFTYRYSLNIDVRTIVNRPPDVATAGFPGTLYVNEPLDYTFTVTDPDGDDASFRIINMPTGMTLDGRTVRWAPGSNEVGRHTLSLEVNDGVSYLLTVQLNFEVRLMRNRPPQLTRYEAPLFAAIGHSYAYQFSAHDPDNNPLTFEVLGAPQGMTIDQSGWLQMNNIPISAVGEYPITVRALDGQGGRAWIDMLLRVNFNKPPQLTNQPSTAAFVGKAYNYGMRATDLEGMPITFTLSNPPEGMTINDSGELRWTPTAEQVGPHAVSVVITDALGDSSNLRFDLIVYTDQILYRKVCAAEVP